MYHFTDVPDAQYLGADHYVDPVSKVVLTKRRARWINGYHVDLRGLEGDGVWRSEFFCEPETVLVTDDGHYQDAAWLWFPRATQRGGVPFTVIVQGGTARRVTDRYGATEIGPDGSAFAGLLDREHGVLAGVASVSPGVRLGVMKGYLGLELEAV